MLSLPLISANASPLGWTLALAAALAYAVPAAGALRISQTAARWALRLAWLLHGLALASSLAGMTPRFGFAPALSMTAWLVLTVYAVEQQLFPQMRARWALATLGACAVLLAALFPGTPLYVSASPWLPLHLALGLASYGLFAAAVVHAALMNRAEQSMRQGAGHDSGLPLLTLERLTFRFVSAGFLLLTATLAAGWLFGEQLYGRAWVWNHKAVFSVLSWLTFAVLLAGRMRFGWRGRSATRMLYAGALLLLLAYAGSRFVMEVLLNKGAA
ncbi:cytochrome C assembly family protein [Comamonas composti]|uniref:cytochrome C assembly family protein n=1 Tax=Comamonas composti TaxID=408558 RepID=UPI0004074741|nr:cytochrome c biogenesis protein CcsA [Comamonas composti]